MPAEQPHPVEALTDQLERSLMRELRAAYYQLNHAYFGGALKPAVLLLSDADKTLGQWHHERRTLDISRRLTFEQPWGVVLEVLKHEMAHQYAHEVLGATDETAHGPAFQHVCRRLGIDAAATGLPSATASKLDEDDPRSRALRKVADLLALARSSNQHEAETAAAMAQRLMLKHNIALAQQRGDKAYGFRNIGEPKGRIYEPEHLLACILTEHYFVEAIWVPAYRVRDGKRGSVLEICGTADNLELACYAHTFLKGTAERLWKEHKATDRIQSNRDRRSYLAGVMEGFRERLRSEKSRNEERGLVWVGDADLQRFYRLRHPSIRSVRLRGPLGDDARQRGREAGRQIVLHRGMSAEASAQGPRALPRGRDT